MPLIRMINNLNWTSRSHLLLNLLSCNSRISTHTVVALAATYHQTSVIKIINVAWLFQRNDEEELGTISITLLVAVVTQIKLKVKEVKTETNIRGSLKCTIKVFKWSFTSVHSTPHPLHCLWIYWGTISGVTRRFDWKWVLVLDKTVAAAVDEKHLWNNDADEDDVGDINNG